MRNLDKSSFVNQINALQKATSVQGKIYHSISVDGNTVRFTRQGKSNTERINLDELFELYKSVDYPTNKEAREYISGRVQSPAVSIINSLGKVSANISPLKQKTKPVIQSAKPNLKKATTKSAKKDKDETRFFEAFAEVVGENYLLSKSIEKPISGSDAFLSDDFNKYDFPKAITAKFESLLKDLNSNFNFFGKSIAHNIDGLLVNHPKLGSRIVEFDEEQHFTPSLNFALSKQAQEIELGFTAYYHSVLKNVNYLNSEVLRKNRIKQSFSAYTLNHNDFTEALKNEKESGYIEPKENGFNYKGGRLAQRAYYDALRNAAHLSPLNKNFSPILRFPKKYFEDKTGTKFSNLTHTQIKSSIKDFMQEVYGLKI